MSATGRSDVRHEQDAYITPPWAVRRFLEAYRLPASTTMVLDPCAARGELLSVVKNAYPSVTTVGIELRPECFPELSQVCESMTGDFLEISKGLPDKAFDVVLTNFPFGLSEEFLLACLRISKIVITLQRLNWIRGDDRHVLMSDLKPGLFVLPNRPSFNGWATDCTEYSWFVFGDEAVAGRWFMLSESNKKERSAWSKAMRAIYPKPKKRQKQKQQEQHKEAS